MNRTPSILLLFAACGLGSVAAQSFDDLFTLTVTAGDLQLHTQQILREPITPVNLESPHVHPLALSPDQKWLAAANTYADKVELFEVVDGAPKHRRSIFTGLNPVTVRFRSDSEMWVVNHVSDSISIHEVPSGSVKRIIETHDEPADVVFSKTSNRAFVSCSQVNCLLAYDLNDLSADPEEIEIKGEDPRALSISPDGRYVYTAIFESGNATTTLGGGRATEDMLAYPANVVNDPRGPYGGVNPPPNDGDKTTPSRLLWTKKPPVGLIVKKSPEGRWMDDNNGDWTAFVSGEYAKESGRVEGWDVVDNDIAILDTETNTVRYAKSLMNIVMGIDVSADDGTVSVIGTEALNHIRYEPKLNGVFIRVKQATVRMNSDGTVETLSNTDLNPHLDYSQATVPQETRDLSIGDPRAIVWSKGSGKAYVAGMGSNNVIVTGRNGDRLIGGRTIEVGEGPTGLALNAAEDRLYVLNRFDGSISVVDTGKSSEISRVSYFDPTPDVIKKGRRHLYDTHRTSGLGQASCASCHVDARMDRLAWDLGDPTVGATRVDRAVDQMNGQFANKSVIFSPQKGPMVTQTLQGIIGNGPFHWRGDKEDVEDFNINFETLLGDDEQLTKGEMAEFKSFINTIVFPPNPYRNDDHSMPEKVQLPNQFAMVDGERVPLPAGDPVRGSALFNSEPLDHFEGRRCTSCHEGLSGGGGYQSVRAPAVSELTSMTQKEFKPSQLRNVHEKIGFDAGSKESLSGFGYLHDGTIDTLARYLSQPQFEDVGGPQALADTIAFIYSMNGNDVPAGMNLDDIRRGLFSPALSDQRVLRLLFGRGPTDTAKMMHAGVGAQMTIDPAENKGLQAVSALRFLSIVDESNGTLDAVLHADIAGEMQMMRYEPEQLSFTNDRRETAKVTSILAHDDFRRGVITLVHPLMAPRLSGDSDGDGLYDREELADLDPTTPGVQNPFDPFNADSTGNSGSNRGDRVLDGFNDYDGDGVLNIDEFLDGTSESPPRIAISTGDEQEFVLQWEAEANTAYIVEMSLDLDTWDVQSVPIHAGDELGMVEWKPGEWVTRYTARYFRVRRIRP